MCHGLCALHHRRPTAVPGSRLLLLHVHRLCARRYGLWASQGRELSKELIARTPLILRLSPSYFANRRAAHVPLSSLWRRPSLQSLPTHATGSVLCIMGGRLWFLDHACSSYTCTGSNARHYGLWAIQGRELRAELIAWSPLILPFSPNYFNKRRAAHVPRCFLWKRLSLRSLPTHAMGSALCVMGGRLRFLGHACSSCMSTGSALDIMDYGLAKVESSVKN